MARPLIIIILLLALNSCNEKRKVEIKNSENVTSSSQVGWAKNCYSGVWVSYDAAEYQEHKSQELKSNDLAFSDVIMIDSCGEDRYKVIGLKEIGNKPTLGYTNYMDLGYKGAPRQNMIVEGNYTLIYDGYHILRFSSHDSPVSFDLEVMFDTKPFRWIKVGKYIRVPVNVCPPSGFQHKDYLDKHWGSHRDE